MTIAMLKLGKELQGKNLGQKRIRYRKISDKPYLEAYNNGYR